MLNSKELLTPDDALIHRGSNHHLIHPSRESAKYYLDVANQAVVSAGLVVPEDSNVKSWVVTPIDEVTDLKLEVVYSKDNLGKNIPVNSELIVSNQDASRLNEITFWMFEFNEKEPWTADPDVWGRYISPESRYIRDYTPTEFYIESIGAFIRERAESRLFVATEHIPHALSLPK